ncbi:MAG: hypothetical protein OEV93_01055 [Candidatus Moranbacteria bacterium]|nr:hypothetical protein [Candidatus Moranbacteria bacterium]
MTDENKNPNDINSLREQIAAAEKTIRDAKSALLKLGEDHSSKESGNIIHGEFDGQIMIGEDGKQYPIPANYASKSKLIEGDQLKLTITPDGSFIYKQIGPAERKTIIGSVNQDESGNFYVISEGKPYKVLLASITYFKVEPGDEVVIITSKNKDSSWAAIENVLRKGGSPATSQLAPQSSSLPVITSEKTFTEKGESESIMDTWVSDIEDIKKEMREEKLNNE